MDVLWYQSARVITVDSVDGNDDSRIIHSMKNWYTYHRLCRKDASWDQLDLIAVCYKERPKPESKE